MFEPVGACIGDTMSKLMSRLIEEHLLLKHNEEQPKILETHGSHLLVGCFSIVH